MSNSRKETEQFYLDLLRRSVSTFPEGTLTPGESPDFVLKTKSEQIGIEITRLFKAADSLGKHLQAQETERALLVSKACSLYEAMALPFVEAHFMFAYRTAFNKTNRLEFAKKVSLLIGSNVPPNKSWVALENKFKDPDRFPYEIDYISIARYDHTKNFWSISGGGIVQEDFIPELQSLISKKDKLLGVFNQHCELYWLVIVLDNMAESTLFEPSNKTLNHIYVSDFNRIFLLDRIRGSGFELQKRRAA